MVKGNGDRRRELAAMRKQDQLEEISRKKSGPLKATPTEIRAILLDLSTKGFLLDGKEELKVWVISNPDCADEQPSTCISYLRTGDCSLKKCKYKHTQSLCKLKNMTDPLEGGGIPPLVPVLLVDFTDPGDNQIYDRRLRTKVRRESPLRFIEYQGECIYDYQFPEVFVGFVSRFRKEKEEKPLEIIHSDERKNDLEEEEGRGLVNAVV